MRCFARPGERPARAASLLCLAVFTAVLAACGPRGSGGDFEVQQVETHWANGRLDVRYRQRLVLSPEARDALVHGVPLTIGTEMILRDAETRMRVDHGQAQHEIRYLPLSEHYQLSGDDGGPVRTYPRLRHALAALGRSELSLETGALPGGDYELLVRSYLDKQQMPPPMRLPVMFSSQWNHASDWTSWPLHIEPGA